ncbi:MAG: chloride channel protein [Burkholderiaceae bacterium]
MLKFNFNARQARRLRDFISLGVGAVLVAIAIFLFSAGANWGTDVSSEIYKNYPLALLVIMPVGFGLLRYLTVKYAPFAAGSGVPQTMAVLRMHDVRAQLKGILSPVQALIKGVFVCLALACGATVGREGPSIQIGAAIMSYWAFRVVGRVRVSAKTIVIAGGASGLAAAFNAPLAGILFALEELSRGKEARSSWFLVLMILTAGFSSLSIFGSYNFFPIENRSDVVPSIGLMLALAIGCGLLAGFMAWLMVKGIPVILPKTKTAAGAGAVAAGIGFVLALFALATDGYSMGEGYHTASELLNESDQYSDFLGFGFFKYVAMTLSFSSGIPGGIFLPSLSIGAGMGHDFALLFNNAEARQFLVIVGMAAFLSGVIQAPITTAVLLVEMTGNQSAFLYILLVAFTGAYSSRIIFYPSLYEVLISKILHAEPPKS